MGKRLLRNMALGAAAGMVQGYGEAKVYEGRTKREVMLQKAQNDQQFQYDMMKLTAAHNMNMKRDEQQHTQAVGLLNKKNKHLMDRDAAQHTRQAGLLSQKHRNQLEVQEVQHEHQMHRDEADRTFKASEGLKTREAQIRKARNYANMRGNKTTAADQQKLEYSIDVNTDDKGTVNWRNVQHTLDDLEKGGANSVDPVDNLTAMNMADVVTRSLAHPVWPDSMDDGFDVTGGDRELFKSKMEQAIKSGDRETAYRLIGDDEDAKKVLDGHFGPQEQPSGAQNTREAGYTHQTPLPLPEGGATALEVGKWYQTPRGIRQFKGWSQEKGMGEWQAPDKDDDTEAMRKRDLGIPR